MTNEQLIASLKESGTGKAKLDAIANCENTAAAIATLESCGYRQTAEKARKFVAEETPAAAEAGVPQNDKPAATVESDKGKPTKGKAKN